MIRIAPAALRHLRPCRAGAIWLLLAMGAGAPAAASRPNLLLVTLDTVRADALGVNGAGGARTPNLDRLARGGVNFTRARAPTPLTLPSHASILTASYPPAHGVRENGAYRLADEQLTLAEVLRQSGYATAAFVGSFVLDHRFGLAQGFTVYDDRVARQPAMLERIEAERSAAEVLAPFEAWLTGGAAKEPFFAWLHFYDPHAPYEPPEPYRTRHAGDLYAGEVAYVDEVVGRAVGMLERRELMRRTLVAVAGDHGEGLGEHGEATHALLIYNSTLHVPMLLHGRHLVPAGVQVDELVRLIDLAPTLLDYLGLDTPIGDGTSLRGLIDDAASGGASRQRAPPLQAYSESLYGRLNLGWSPLHALESGGYRLIQAPRPELYDLTADPGETRNLISSHAELAGRLRADLRRLLAGGRPTAAARQLDDEAVARLRSLGYLSGSRPVSQPAGELPLPDPKSKMEVWESLQQAMALHRRGEHRPAAAALEEILATERAIPLVYDYLGSAYLRLEDWPRAEQVYRRAIAAGLGTAAFHTELALLLDRKGATEQAEASLRAALDLDPASVLAHHRLADLHRRSGRRREAAAHYRQALAVNPRYVFAWNGLGMTLAADGLDDQALAAFRHAVDAAPAAAQGVFNLAVQLERMGRRQEALEAYRHVIELAEGDAALAAEQRQAAAAVARLLQPR